MSSRVGVIPSSEVSIKGGDDRVLLSLFHILSGKYRIEYEQNRIVLIVIILGSTMKFRVNEKQNTCPTVQYMVHKHWPEQLHRHHSGFWPEDETI